MEFDTDEEYYRYNVFRSNLKKINDLKEIEKEATFEVNEFAHLPHEEFKNKYFVPILKVK